METRIEVSCKLYRLRALSVILVWCQRTQISKQFSSLGISFLKNFPIRSERYSWGTTPSFIGHIAQEVEVNENLSKQPFSYGRITLKNYRKCVQLKLDIAWGTTIEMHLLIGTLFKSQLLTLIRIGLLNISFNVGFKVVITKKKGKSFYCPI